MIIIIYLAILVLVLAGLWKVFVKMGRPGWEGIVPIYNLYIILTIVGKPIWWLIVILLVPIANLVLSILLFIELAKKFGKTPGFGVGMALLGFVFIPILGFGPAKFQGAAAPPAVPPAQR